MSAIRSATTVRVFTLLAVCAAAVLGACGELTKPAAQIETIVDTATVYALSGAPAGAPTSLYIYAKEFLIASPSFGFDVAFDIDSAGRAVLLPVRTLVSALASGGHQVGLQQMTGTAFDSIGEAPLSGYHYDSTMVVAPGVTVTIDSRDPVACGTSLFSQSVYGKIEVTGVDVVGRKLHLRFGFDPNCGYRSFAAGIPTS